MKFDKQTIELLEILVESLCQRIIVVKTIGKDNDIVRELEKQIDAIEAKMTGEI